MQPVPPSNAWGLLGWEGWSCVLGMLEVGVELNNSGDGDWSCARLILEAEIGLADSCWDRGWSWGNWR